MKSILAAISFCFIVFQLQAQKAFHVFPKDHPTIKGSKLGDGSLKNPWDLQTALNQKSEVVNGGDTIWLHGGIYSGRFTSKLQSTIPNKNIIVTSYKGEWAIINGNVPGPNVATLSVVGKNVTYRDFEISPINLKVRDEKVAGFRPFGGVSHNSGKNCKFINLIIHGNNGLGFGSWNKTGGTIISNCIVYDNGYVGKSIKGLGEGFYVQNDSDTEIRVLKNNIIFNNYYKGIEVWSANKKANREYVKNITLDNNVIFNSGLVSGRTVDNIIVATNDRNGINIAKNITVTNNILYHNTNYLQNEVNGDAPSLTIGYYKNAPVENIFIKNNLILGRNNPFRLLHAKSVSISNNVFYGGYIHLLSQTANNLNPISLNNNTYYTKNKTPFRVDKEKYMFSKWQSVFKQDSESSHDSLEEFDLPSVLDISKNDYKDHSYRVVLFSKNENDIIVDFSNYDIAENSNYVIRDVENLDVELKTGTVKNDSKIVFPMKLERNENRSLNNFGVYIIEFKPQLLIEAKEGFFNRLFKWLF
ncbi:right-handed parallel beta-helix repeat-containing protein [Hanstruepera ponticola]|uniref:right-handed parallel beta-helix repeat-containing protein n=1 Tax=Hanstruepera ponticola TaxID=2042995 RepID=UPI000CF05769|nr:right-handed parallel beta-helix repeat-containing protein [Hanstruepera ponticola]